LVSPAVVIQFQARSRAAFPDSPPSSPFPSLAPLPPIDHPLLCPTLTRVRAYTRLLNRPVQPPSSTYFTRAMLHTLRKKRPLPLPLSCARSIHYCSIIADDATATARCLRVCTTSLRKPVPSLFYSPRASPPQTPPALPHRPSLRRQCPPAKYSPSPNSYQLLFLSWPGA
jgi:hypothetical protein